MTNEQIDELLNKPLVALNLANVRSILNETMDEDSYEFKVAFNAVKHFGRVIAEALPASPPQDAPAPRPIHLPILSRGLVSDVLDAVILFATSHAEGNPDPMPNTTALDKIIALLAERGHVIGEPIQLQPYVPEATAGATPPEDRSALLGILQDANDRSFSYDHLADTILSAGFRRSAAPQDTTASPTGKKHHVIYSGEGGSTYWRPNRAGYSMDVLGAGLYSREEAEAATNHCGPEKKIKVLSLIALLAIAQEGTVAELLLQTLLGQSGDTTAETPKEKHNDR